jgi:hypothetical protein
LQLFAFPIPIADICGMGSGDPELMKGRQGNMTSDKDHEIHVECIGEGIRVFVVEHIDVIFAAASGDTLDIS